ncbi:hypothetical protein H6P81_016526 [Aristolochia fimbriata]|uniref:Uncharacterized protein n=1 Tax=Aristolochia fimbriata TaxID=158543 RepID=A0AAV7EBM2_ARIFI|nr:hypothetical protein H6P81_016526 [Aristolochia fimbriata]
MGFIQEYLFNNFEPSRTSVRIPVVTLIPLVAFGYTFLNSEDATSFLRKRIRARKKMSSSPFNNEALDLVCRLENVQGIVDALTSVKWKKLQDAVIELSEHGIVLIVEETGCLQAKVYLKRELFVSYEYTAEGRPRFGLSLGLFIDCLNMFSTAVEIRYPGSDMQLILKSVGSQYACAYAEIRTRIPETISWDCDFEPTGGVPVTFTIKSAGLKEAIDDLEWPGSSIQIILNPDPPTVTFRGDGHGDLQIDLPYFPNSDLFMAFQCRHPVSFRYKYKFLQATTANFPNNVIKDNRGSKLTIGRGGMLKVQHLVTVAKSGSHNEYRGYQQPGRIAYIEFYLKPEEEESIHDS